MERGGWKIEEGGRALGLRSLIFDLHLQVGLGQRQQAPLLGRCDRFLGRTEGAAAACAHFDENEATALFGHQVDLAAWQPDVALDQPITAQRKVAGSDLLAGPS
jgi:hypothetical protein